MAKESISNNIFISRDAIREQIITELKEYMELQDVDLVKSSFLSFIIDILSKVTSNLMFYQTNMYNEFFLTKAQLPESVLNLSAFLGYNTREATYATTDLLFSVPLDFTVEETYFKIANGYIAKASNIKFQTYYDAEVFISNNSSARIKITTEDNRSYFIPSSITDGVLNFVLPVRQYEVQNQQFQVDSDIQEYQFVTYDLPIDGKVSELEVTVTEPGQSEAQAEIYTEVDSLYLMSSTTKGYVSRRTENGRRLYFGNGLIGYQPPADSTLDVDIIVTQGQDGNVISGSVKDGTKLYNTTITINGTEYNTSNLGKTKIVNYEIVNTSSAVNGTDEEGIEDIRSNSIANITALKRLVSGDDYANANVVIDNSPLSASPLAVLKRSDLKQNEIQLYSNLVYDDAIVPTRNLQFQWDSTSVIYPRGTIIPDNGTDFQTLFDINIVNGRAEYQYVTEDYETAPTLVFNDDTYDITVDKTIFKRIGESAIFELYYQNNTVGLDSTSIDCKFVISPFGLNGDMVNDADNSMFTYTIPYYGDVPEGDINVSFQLSENGNSMATYQTSLVYIQSFKNFMYSNMVTDSTTGDTLIYDVPCIESDYYNSVDGVLFESLVLQEVAKFDFTSYRMLTDFCNVKFSNSTGSMINMTYNKTNKFPVKTLSLSTVPVTPNLGDRYIISGQEGGDWEGRRNYIAVCVAESPVAWQYFKPVADDNVLVEDEGIKYTFSEYGWIYPVYTTPLELEMEVFRVSTYAGSDAELAQAVKEAIVVAFDGRFGSNVTLYRSEIVDVIQNVEGVSHCRLIKPETNIFFDFELETFTQDELLNYTPEYVYFTENEITVTIL